MTEAEEGGCDQVWGMRGSLRMVSSITKQKKHPAAVGCALLRLDRNVGCVQFPPKGVKQDLPAAFAAYTVCF